MVKINSCAKNFGELIDVYIKNAFFGDKPIILCIGSDKATGDCLAPLTGTLLTRELNVNTYVYGTLECPVNALNIKEIYSEIKILHPNKKILCIDACLGLFGEVGFFKLSTEGLFPGSAFKKATCRYGDFSILAVIDEISENKFSIFRTRLKNVYNMSRSLSLALKNAIG